MDKTNPQQIFFDMFAGFLPEYNPITKFLDIEGGEDLNTQISEELNDMLVNLVERVKEGDYSFIPSENDEYAVAIFNDAYRLNTEYFVNLVVNEIFPRFVGKNKHKYNKRHLPFVFEVKDSLDDFVDENIRKREPLFKRYKELLKKSESFPETALAKPLDMLVYSLDMSRLGKSKAILDLCVLRLKRKERIAQKVARAIVNLIKDYDKMKRLGGEILKTKYKDFFVTDIPASTLVFSKSIEWDLAPLYKEDLKLKRIRSKDASEHVRKSQAKQSQEKFYDMKSGLVFSLNNSDLENTIRLQFGESGHHMYVAKEDERYSKGRYGEIYEEVKERVLKFLNACDIRSIEPFTFSYTYEKNKKRRIGEINDGYKKILEDLKLGEREIEIILGRDSKDLGSLQRRLERWAGKKYQSIKRDLIYSIVPLIKCINYELESMFSAPHEEFLKMDEAEEFDNLIYKSRILFKIKDILCYDEKIKIDLGLERSRFEAIEKNYYVISEALDVIKSIETLKPEYNLYYNTFARLSYVYDRTRTEGPVNVTNVANKKTDIRARILTKKLQLFCQFYDLVDHAKMSGVDDEIIGAFKKRAEEEVNRIDSLIREDVWQKLTGETKTEYENARGLFSLLNPQQESSSS